ncbi:MAG: sensor histidine kinase [Bacteroidota bacterium]
MPVIIKKILIALFLLGINYYGFSVEIQYDTNKINALVSDAKNSNPNLIHYCTDFLNFHSEKIVYRDLWISLNLARNAEKLSIKYDYKAGRADALLNQAIATSLEGDYTESVIFCDSAFLIYNKLCDSTGMVKSLFWMSISYCFSDIEEAQKIVNRIYTFKSMKNNYNLCGDISSVQSFIYFLQGDYDKALKYLDVSITIALGANDKSKLAQCYHKLSLIYSRKGKYDLSLTYSLKALKIFYDNCEYVNVVKILNKIGSILLDQEDLYNAGRVFSFEAKVLKRINIKRSWATYYLYLYQFYFFQNNLGKAIEYLKYGYDIQKTLGDSLNLSQTLGNIASIYVDKNEMDSALDVYEKVLKIQDKIGFNYGKAQTLSDIGIIFNKLKKYQSAVENLELSNSLLINDIDRLLMIDNYNELSKAYIQLKNYPKAYFYLEQYTKQWDSLYKETVQKQIDDLMIKYESEEKDYKIKKLSDAQEISDLKSKRERLYTIILIILVLMLTALFFLIYITVKQRQKNKYQTLVNETQRKIANAILEAQDKERNAIGRDLHDSIGAMVATAKLNLSNSQNENTEKIKDNISSSVKDLDQVIKELREVARNLMTDIITESGIQQAFQLYVDKINHAQAEIKFKFMSLGNFSKMNNSSQIILYKIFLELTNNCIKYSMATEATVELAELDKQVVFTMEDNGVGFDVEKCLNKGLGLQNINYRVTLLGGKCQIDSLPGKGTSISIELNVKQE